MKSKSIEIIFKFKLRFWLNFLFLASTCTVFSSERVLTAWYVRHNKTEDPQNLVEGVWAPKSKMADPGVSAQDIILDPIGSYWLWSFIILHIHIYHQIMLFIPYTENPHISTRTFLLYKRNELMGPCRQSRKFLLSEITLTTILVKTCLTCTMHMLIREFICRNQLKFNICLVNLWIKCNLCCWTSIYIYIYI